MFELNKLDLKDKKLYLDLGNVQELAEIIINGKSVGVSWMPPFNKDITNFVHAGKNELTVRVTNLWVNRLIGDQFLPEEKRYTKTNIIKFKKDDPLRISGLLGPVKIIYSRIIPITKLN
jgi:(4-O-methyl)-D-glucuronate---lignin esterase